MNPTIRRKLGTLTAASVVIGVSAVGLLSATAGADETPPTATSALTADAPVIDTAGVEDTEAADEPDFEAIDTAINAVMQAYFDEQDITYTNETDGDFSYVEPTTELTDAQWEELDRRIDTKLNELGIDIDTVFGDCDDEDSDDEDSDTEAEAETTADHPEMEAPGAPTTP